MRRPLVIALAVMGGGALAAGLMLPPRKTECEQARAAKIPNAEEICARPSSHSRGSGVNRTAAMAVGLAGLATARSGTPSASVGSNFGTNTGTNTGTGAGIGSVSRGGFGGSGSSFSSSSGG